MIQNISLSGPVGALEAELDTPSGTPQARAVVCHPHPLYGGTMHNAVVTRTAAALVERGAATLRFNFRGVGNSTGAHDGGQGEKDDLGAALAWSRERYPDLPLWLAGYSFGAVMVLDRLARMATTTGVEGTDKASTVPERALLLAPPVTHYDFTSARETTVPVAVIAGGQDELTPREALEECFGRWSGQPTIEWIGGAGHDLATASAPAALDKALAKVLG